jgi:hypothetical protein
MSWYFFIFFFVIVFAAIWDLSSNRKIPHDPIGFIIAMWIIVIVSTWFSYYAYLVNHTYGIFHYSVILIFSIVLLVLDTKKISNYTLIQGSTLIINLVIILFMFIAVVPVAVIPYFSGTQEQKSLAFSQDISPKPILDNLGIIKESIEDTKDKLSIEVESIDKLASVLVGEIEKKNDELVHIENERNLALEELEYYKSLASLNKDQADAILKTINKPKYLDYIIGLVIGFVTSGAFFIIQNFYQKKRKHLLVTKKNK